MRARVFTKQYNHLKKVGDKAFENVFYALQLLNYTALNDVFAFTNDEMKQFNANIKDYNNSCLDDKQTFHDEEKRLLDEYNIDCEKYAKAFPWRSKVRMINHKFSNKFPQDIALSDATDSINVCMVLFLHELTTNWGKTPDEIAEYCEKIKDNSMCYANGMTNEFVLNYFKEYFDLEITM